MDNEIKKETYPAIDLIYEQTLKANELSIQRYDIVDGKIDQLLTWISSITLGILAIIGIKGEMSYFHFWAYNIAMFFFGLCLLIGVIAKIKGFKKLGLPIITATPENLYKTRMFQDIIEYKIDIIYWGGIHFAHNLKLINLKGQLSVLITWSFIIEAIFLGIWLYHLG